MKSGILYGLLSACLAFAQAPAKPIAFEVASIKPAQPMPMGRMMVRMNADAGMLRYTNVSLKDCIRTAYRVKEFQIQGPDWLGSTRFDIAAKLPEGSSQDQIPEMLQSLLADRFKLALHRDTKEHAVYVLVVAKGGPKLKAAEAPAPEKPAEAPNVGKGTLPRGGMMMMMGPRGVHLKAASATLSSLAETLSRFSERPVVDMTGIKGQYDFDLAFAPETMPRLPPGPGKPGDETPATLMPAPGGGERRPADAATEGAGSIFEAVRPYGLKLEPRKAPMEILTVDHIEKTPTEN